MLLQISDEPLARPRIGITPIHEAVHIAVLDVVLLGDVDEFQQVVQRGMNATRGSQAHQVQALAIGLGIAVGRLDLRVLQDGIVGTGAVDLHQVLIDDAPGADVQVARLRVSHLSVGQPHVLARGLQFGVRIAGLQVVHVGRSGLCYHVPQALVADAPAVENNQQRLLGVAVVLRHSVVINRHTRRQHRCATDEDGKDK